MQSDSLTTSFMRDNMLQQYASPSRDQSSLQISDTSVSSFGGATFCTGAKRASDSQRARLLFQDLLDTVRNEWKTIKTMNLGELVNRLKLELPKWDSYRYMDPSS